MDHKPESIQEWIKKFTAQLGNANTATSYASELNHFAPWVERYTGSNSIEVLARLKYDDIEEYLADRAQTVDKAAMAKAHAALWTFYFYLGSQHMVRNNPLEAIKPATAQRRTYLIPSKAELRSVLDNIKSRLARAIHDLFYEGLTPSDVAALDVSSIDWDSSALVRPWDGQKLPLGPWAMDSLKAWREERDALLTRMGYRPDCTPALFIGSRMKGIMNPKHQARLCVRSLDRISKECAQGRTPRLIRIACGVHMLEAGADVRIVAAQLGVQLAAVEHMEKMAKRGRYAIQGAQEKGRRDGSSESE